MNPYRPADNEGLVYVPPRKIARCGLAASLCFAFGSMGIPIGLGLASMFWANSYSPGLKTWGGPSGVAVLFGSFTLLMVGWIRMQRRNEALNHSPHDQGFDL